MSKFISFFLLVVLTGCRSTELITVRNDEGVVIEEYSVNKETQERQGEYKAYDDKGKLIEAASYKDGQLQGIRTVYFEDGKTQAIENYEGGEFEGAWIGYYKTGAIELEGNYVNNEMTGIWKRFYPDGKLMEEVSFSENNENGPFKEYYPDGKLKAEGNYLDGDNEHGELKLYDEEGNLERIMDCDRGRCITRKNQENEDRTE